jgi:cobalt-zinc-cadmium efflux system outer membrane protein
MSFQRTSVVWAAVLCYAHPECRAQDDLQSWSASQVIERFLAQSPQAQEPRARVALAEAEGHARTVYANPSFGYSREGAGYNGFFEASEILPLSGRIGVLRRAVDAAVSAAEANRDAALWSLRTDLRIAFYRMVASQERLGVLSNGATEVDQLIRILRKREDEGEGSRYDRLRAEREAAELRIDLTVTRSFIAAAASRVDALLPEGTNVQHVRGELRVPRATPDLESLVRRAMGARADYRAEQLTLARYQIEEQAARRLRIPEPQITLGLKRADNVSGLPPMPLSIVRNSGSAFSVSVPLPVFNNGRYEVARYRAEQDQVNARLAVLNRQICTEIQGAREVVEIRRAALAEYQREVESAGSELTRITQIAYQEGEIGILELLDSLRVSRAVNLRLLDLMAGLKEAFIELERVVGEEVGP